MLIGGREFPETPDGWFAASDHVRSLGPVFERDADDCIRQGCLLAQEIRAHRIFNVGLLVVLLGGLAIWLWK